MARANRHEALKHGRGIREVKWSESIAVGSEAFVERVKEELGIRAKGREVRELEGQFELREPPVSSNALFEGKKSDIRLENTYFWSEDTKIVER
jgi:putative transposase